MDRQNGSKPGTFFFWLIFLVIAGAIFATVLAANNGRNYHKLMDWLGIEVAPQTMQIPRPGTVQASKGGRLSGAGINIDSHLFMPEVKEMDSGFIRDFTRDGKALCDVFSKLGFKMSKWQPSAVAGKINECYDEEVGPDEANPDAVYSFFLIVKGTKSEIISTRIKFIFTDDKTRELVSDKAMAIMGAFARETHWLDIMAHADDLRTLKPFNLDAFGLNVRFTAEFTGIGRYNLIFSRDGKMSKAEKRSLKYFDGSNYLRLPPEYGIVQETKERPKPAPPVEEQDGTDEALPAPG